MPMKKWYVTIFRTTIDHECGANSYKRDHEYGEVLQAESIEKALHDIEERSPRSTVLSIREISISEIFGMPEQEVWSKCDQKIAEINKRKETRDFKEKQIKDWISSN